MSSTSRAHWVLGDPTSNRFADYCAAADRLGMPTPRCVDWIEVAEHGTQVLDQIPANVRLRIDSFGQRDEGLAALIRKGGGIEFPRRGEILSLNHQFRGLSEVLRDLDDWAQRRDDVHLGQDPLEIAVMFDKWATHRRMLPFRPDTILLPTDPGHFDATLRRFVRECGGRVFVKPRYGSSASGVCCYRISKDCRQLIAPIEITREAGRVRLFNSLRVRSFTRPRDLRDIFHVLVPQGMIAEAAISKARIEGDRFDLRFVVIDGRADHVVVRQSPTPITNLHLGNRRGTLDAVIDAVGSDRVEACRELALHAAGCFPRTRYCGVDILLPRSNAPLVCEVNAFGDFLPRLVANGRTVYEAILQASCRRREVTA